jgi:hypothetical protein
MFTIPIITMLVSYSDNRPRVVVVVSGQQVSFFTFSNSFLFFAYMATTTTRNAATSPGMTWNCDNTRLEARLNDSESLVSHYMCIYALFYIHIFPVHILTLLTMTISTMTITQSQLTITNKLVIKLDRSTRPQTASTTSTSPSVPATTIAPVPKK